MFNVNKRRKKIKQTYGHETVGNEACKIVFQDVGIVTEESSIICTVICFLWLFIQI